MLLCRPHHVIFFRYCLQSSHRWGCYGTYQRLFWHQIDTWRGTHHRTEGEILGVQVKQATSGTLLMTPSPPSASAMPVTAGCVMTCTSSLYYCVPYIYQGVDVQYIPSP